MTTDGDTLVHTYYYVGTDAHLTSVALPRHAPPHVGGQRAARFTMRQLVFGTRRAVALTTKGDPQEMANLLVDAASVGDTAAVGAMLTFGVEVWSTESE